MRITRKLRAAFSMPEMLIALGVLGITGMIVFEGVNTQMVLFAKNSAVNLSHQEGRKAVNRLVRDLHAAVSVPQLIDANFNNVDTQPVDGSGKPTGTPGVMFQILVPGSPNYVLKDTPNDMIMIRDNGSPPMEGQRLVAPMWNIEQDIYKVTVASQNGHHNIWLVDGSEVTMKDTLPGSGLYAITYYTDRVAYKVVNGELHFYKRRMSGNSFYYQDVATVARNITSATPFTIPLNASGTPDARYVGVRLMARDPATSNRNYRSTVTLLNTAIPYRSRICKYQ